MRGERDGGRRSRRRRRYRERGPSGIRCNGRESIDTSNDSINEEPDDREEEEVERKEGTSAEEFRFHEFRHWPQ
jgi:hypothetical protein